MKTKKFIELLVNNNQAALIKQYTNINWHKNIDFNIVYEEIKEIDNPMVNGMFGFMYVQGLGVQKDEKKAKHYYKLSAKFGNIDAICDLAYLYEKGEIVEKNYKKAIKYYQFAADQGHHVAQNCLGSCYEKGSTGIKKDSKKAFYYYKLAADQNNTLAQNNIGCLYYEGIGCDKDIEEAIHYLTLSANQNFMTAIKNLAHIYKNTQKNFERALYYYSLADDKEEIVKLFKDSNFEDKEIHVINLIKENNRLKIENKKQKKKIAHYKYKPGKGYEASKKHFDSLV